MKYPQKHGRPGNSADILLQDCNAVCNWNTIDRWIKGCILLFPKEGDLRIAKNYQGITLTSIVAKIYNALLHNRIEPKIEKILRKNQIGFLWNQSMTSQILTISQILEGVHAKILEATILFVNFSKPFDSIHRGKMEQIFLAYRLPKEMVAAIMMLYKNMKVKVHSQDGDRQFRHCSRCAIPDQAESLLHSLEQAASGIGLYVNADKTEYMCFNQRGNISTH